MQVAVFLFGAIVGSFLNVVALRWNSGVGLHGRSACPRCAKVLRFYELVPIVSFLALRGRCLVCSARISWRYPLVEVATGVMFLGIFLTYGVSWLSLVAGVMFSLYTVILLYDLRHKIIPDELVYTSILLALVVPIFLKSYSTLDWLAGAAIFAFFFLIWYASRGRALGLGDAKLGASMGLFLGAAQGFSAIVMAFWIGAAVTLSYMFVARVVAGKRCGNPLLSRGKGLTMKSEIPFAPFMVVGAWASIILDLDLLHVGLL